MPVFIKALIHQENREFEKKKPDWFNALSGFHLLF
jgi:hypothetical protein